MKIVLQLDLNNEPINRQDILWLSYLWECSDGFEATISLKELPSALYETVVYKDVPSRFRFYVEKEKLFQDFEYIENNRIYVIMMNDFVFKVNLLIDKCNERYNMEIKHISPKKKERVIVNNVNNSGNYIGELHEKASVTINSQNGTTNSNIGSGKGLFQWIKDFIENIKSIFVK